MRNQDSSMYTSNFWPSLRSECSIKMCEQTIRRNSLRIKYIILNMRSCKPNGYAIASITYNPRSLIKQPAGRALRKKARRLSVTQKRKILKICKQISTWIHCFEAETRVAPPLFFVGPKPTLLFFFLNHELPYLLSDLEDRHDKNSITRKEQP